MYVPFCRRRRRRGVVRVTAGRGWLALRSTGSRDRGKSATHARAGILFPLVSPMGRMKVHSRPRRLHRSQMLSSGLAAAGFAISHLVTGGSGQRGSGGRARGGGCICHLERTRRHWSQARAVFSRLILFSSAWSACSAMARVWEGIVRGIAEEGGTVGIN